jgi:hypothetical protein
MKNLFSILILLTSISGNSTESKYNKLICSSAKGDILVLEGLGKNQLYQINQVNNQRIPLKKTSEGDCKGRKTYCILDGQVMINIPEQLATGIVHTGRIWYNMDVDDRPENYRLGDAYECVAVKDTL